MCSRSLVHMARALAAVDPDDQRAQRSGGQIKALAKKVLQRA